MGGEPRAPSIPHISPGFDPNLDTIPSIELPHLRDNGNESEKYWDQVPDYAYMQGCTEGLLWGRQELVAKCATFPPMHCQDARINVWKSRLENDYSAL
jgi:hypothetical protein